VNLGTGKRRENSGKSKWKRRQIDGISLSLFIVREEESGSWVERGDVSIGNQMTEGGGLLKTRTGRLLHGTSIKKN